MNPAEPEGGVLVVAVPDPEEQDRDATQRSGAGGSQDTDAVFASIIASWRSEPDAPRWPAETDPAPDRPGPDSRIPGETSAAPPARPPDGEDDHYQPPEPPPLPVPRPRTLGGLALLALGVLLLVRPSLLGLGGDLGTLLGLLSITAGIGWLVLGLRTGPPSEGWDDGARV